MKGLKLKMKAVKVICNNCFQQTIGLRDETGMIKYRCAKCGNAATTQLNKTAIEVMKPFWLYEYAMAMAFSSSAAFSSSSLNRFIVVALVPPFSIAVIMFVICVSVVLRSFVSLCKSALSVIDSSCIRIREDIILSLTLNILRKMPKKQRQIACNLYTILIPFTRILMLSL